MAELLADGTLVRDGKPISWNDGVTTFGDTQRASLILFERIRRKLIFARIVEESRNDQS